MNKSRCTILTCFSLLMSTQAFSYDLSWELFEGDGLALLKEAETSSDPDVLYKAANLLIDESVMQANIDRAHEYLEQALKSGHDGAETLKADLEYSDGNYEEALSWYHKAEGAQDPYVLYSLGVMYFDGEGTEQDVKKGNEYYLASAKLGDDDAMYQLAFSYNDGVGVEKDYAKAAYWFEQAAKQQNASAIYNLGIAYLNGEGVEMNCQKAIQHFEHAIELEDHTRSVAKLGDIYYYPKYKQRCGFKTTDYAKSFEYFQKAAMLDDIYAQYMVGYAYRNGHGVFSDFAKSLAWFEIAQENGDEDAEKEILNVKQYMSNDELAKAQQYKNEIIDEIW
ncbi:sel1 repeat family protein [Vibrio europaeus]|uniref:tetratricopeptide repeat protein n=1 Tax=Vibrio europaeus TaxID=300876 RepID=UPI00233F98A4|nr:tetratricopeptide repeat protein [Vibrio europaeus]MDC5847866.1 sel1 repeat family protein [Vibrio europaeus]